MMICINYNRTSIREKTQYNCEAKINTKMELVYKYTLSS